jgi:cytidylate kinase
MYAASILLLCNVQLRVLRLMRDKLTRKTYFNKLEYREAVEERRLYVRYVVKDDSSGE